jgi:outer membrane protein assembly factor BamB
MTGETSDSSEPAANSATATRLELLRIAAALLLTSFALPYVWGRSFIGWQFTGKPEVFFGACLAVVIGVVIALTWHVAGDPSRWRLAFAIEAVVIVAWIVVNTYAFYGRISTPVPRPVFLALYIPGSLLIPWVGWMFFSRWSAARRLGIAAILLSWLIAFIAAYRVDGLSGASGVDFSWRYGSRLAPATSTVVSGGEVASGQRLVANPERDFPQFMGPDRTGMLPAARLDRDWKQHPPHELWRRPVGLGWSSFAVVGDFAFTQEQRGEHECVVCYQLTSGDEIWIHSDPVNFTSSLGGPGPRATPTVDGSQLFSVGATGVLNCLDAMSGRRIWSVDILKDNHAENLAHGVCDSPLVLEDRVLVCPTGADGPSLVAYDRNSGDRLWSAGRHGASYSSPMVAKLAGVPQILLYDTAGVTAHDYHSGQPLWHFDWTNNVRVNVAQPIVRLAKPDQVFISTGYDKGCVLIQVDHSADGYWSAWELWDNNRLKSKFCSAVLYGDHVFGLDDGILACVGLETGDRAWKQGRYGHGQILRAGDLLLVQAEDGDVVLGELDPKAWREVGRIKALSGKTWNNPVLAGPYLLVRNDHEAACFELAVMQGSPEPETTDSDTESANHVER